MTDNIKITKPALKWLGGKTSILHEIIPNFPTEINNYHEAFLGGGSILLAVLSHKMAIKGKIYAYDINEALIYLYKNIQTKHNDLYDKLIKIINDYKNCGDGEVNRKPETKKEAKHCQENYYYWIRIKYNNLSKRKKKNTTGSAMFLFLNKTCFRGVYREGPKGFNVPYGHYKNPAIVDKEHLDEIHDLIQNVKFTCCSFEDSLSKVKKGDFIYLDPPYAPETSKSFVGYTEEGFSLEQHEKLFKLIHELTDSDKKIMMSNADVSLVRDNFTDKKYNIFSLSCKRSINSKDPGSKTNEVIITNY